MPVHDILTDLKDFQSLLLNWFKSNKRDLPWRNTYDPYHVWISEIMLQQTQMDRGVSYFLKWIDRFPAVEDVARAGEQEILKMWEGLGYYTRARNLHKCAKIISREYRGVVPCTVEELRQLPGIGPYTAAAISSVAANVTVAAIDANVIRIIVRLLDIDKPCRGKEVEKQINSMAERILPDGQARYWNQALMDFGGMICTSKNPECQLCSIRNYCLAFEMGTVTERPVAISKKKIKKKIRVALFIVADGKLAIRECDGKNNLWRGLWELPTSDIKKSQTPEEGCAEFMQQLLGDSEKGAQLLAKINHSYTTNKVELYPFFVELELVPSSLEATLKWCDSNTIKNYGFSAGTRKTLEYLRVERPDIMELLL